MVRRATSSHPLLALRRAILSAAEALDADRGSSADAFPHGRLLSNVLTLVSLKILSHCQCLGKLEETSSMQTTTAEAARLGPVELLHFSGLLHDRHAAFCPPAVLSAVPTAPFASQASLEAAWRVLSDARLSEHWADERSLGYSYQFLCGPARRASLKDIQSANKAVGLDRLIAFTQLYTPGWIVDYLLEQTILSRWAGSSAAKNGHGKAVSELQLIDPACGAGHFLFPAFDLFLHMHSAEATPPEQAVTRILDHNLAGVDIDGAALWLVALGLLLKSIKCGAPADIRCNRLASVLSKNNAGRNSLLGTLDRSWSSVARHPLSERYDAVVANPPYVGRKLLPRDLKAELKELYPESHQDLCAAFIQRGLDLLEPGGRLGFIAQASLLHLPTYRDLRKHLVEKERLITIVDAGPGVFPLQTGEKVNSALVVVEHPAGECADAAEDSLATFIDLASEQDKEPALSALSTGGSYPGPARVYCRAPRDFEGHPRYAFAYRCPPAIPVMVRRFDKLGAVAEVRQGLATTDNKRFVRYWWDVDPSQRGSRWFPYVKGAGSERWYSPILHVVNWANEGAEIKATVSGSYPYLKGKSGWVVKNEQFYFQEGLTFSFVNTRTLAVRRLPGGCIFDVGGSALFAEEGTLDFLLAYLNSSVMTAIARLFNPTINFQVGDIRDLPVMPLPQRIRNDLSQIAHECYRLKRDLLRFDPTSCDTVIPQEVLDIATGSDVDRIWTALSGQRSSSAGALVRLESQLNETVQNSYLRLAGADAGAAQAIRTWVETETKYVSFAESLKSAKDFAEIVVQFLIRLCLEKGSDGWTTPTSCQVRCDIEDVPFLLPGTDNDQVCRILGLSSTSRAWLEQQLNSSITRYLSERFMSTHSRAFHGSPLYVCLRLPDNGSILVSSSRAIRRRNKQPPEPTAQAIIDEIAGQLAPKPDWTGADLLAILRRAD